MLLRALLKSILLPHTSLLLLMLVAWLGWYRWPRFSRALLGFSLLGLWLMSLPLVGGTMLKALENGYQPLAEVGAAEIAKAQAIVVLGGGRSTDAKEFGGDTVNGRTLARLRYGALVHRQTGLPLLLAGGRVYEQDEPSEAQLMAEVMVNEFQVPVSWQETNSRTTAENARFSADILQQQNIHTILLVTQAWHMPRAMAAFEEVGLKVIAAPTGFTDVDLSNVLNWLPSTSAMQSSYFALHEWLGHWVYQWEMADE